MKPTYMAMVSENTANTTLPTKLALHFCHWPPVSTLHKSTQVLVCLVQQQSPILEHASFVSLGSDDLCAEQASLKVLPSVCSARCSKYRGCFRLLLY